MTLQPRKMLNTYTDGTAMDNDKKETDDPVAMDNV